MSESQQIKAHKVAAFILAFLTCLTVCPQDLQAEGKSTEELAKAAQNPIADFISLPLQNNTNFGVGPTMPFSAPVWMISTRWKPITACRSRRNSRSHRIFNS